MDSLSQTFANRDQPGSDGTIRKAHYGEGRQPWDDIVELGWGPYFAAGCVLRYLRRTKDPEHSLESAQWYYERLVDNSENLVWNDVRKRLLMLLTNEETLRLIIPLINRGVFNPDANRQTEDDKIQGIHKGPGSEGYTG